MKLLALLALAVMATACTTTRTVETTDQDRYETWHMGEITDSAFSYLACASHNMNIGKSDIRVICAEDTTGSLFGGLALVRTPAGDKAFAELFGLGTTMNASLFEYQKCLARVRGKPLLAALRAVNPKQVRQECLARFTKALNDTVGKADPERVCNSEATTQALVEWIASEIEAGKKCEPWKSD
jgi:hypothetical protein